MSIRVTCEECGSVLKIKEELAGTEGRCPKCKTRFTVPAGDAPPTSPATKAVATDAGEFDPVAFLMADDGAKPGAKSAAARPTAVHERTEDASLPEPRVPRARHELKPAHASASGAADALLKGTASANAKELLTRTMEEGRVRAAQMPTEPEREPAIDFRELFRELGMKIIPLLLGIIVAAAGLYWLVYQVVGGGFKPSADLGRVSGVVTRGGKPVTGATVLFTPLDTRAASASAITDEDGEYTLMYVEGIPGAVVGKNRVTVEAYDERGRLTIPADGKYGLRANTQLTVTRGSQDVPLEIP
jgi:predicted Zn finger-like uncharacterized protein